MKPFAAANLAILRAMSPKDYEICQRDKKKTTMGGATFQDLEFFLHR